MVWIKSFFFLQSRCSSRNFNGGGISKPQVYIYTVFTILFTPLSPLRAYGSLCLYRRLLSSLRAVFCNTLASSYLFRIFVSTWNVGESKPSEVNELADLLRSEQEVDVYAIGYVIFLFTARKSKKVLKSCEADYNLSNVHNRGCPFPLVAGLVKALTDRVLI